jgi:hypothetical protein
LRTMRGLGPTPEWGFVDVEVVEVDIEPSAEEAGRFSEEAMMPVRLEGEVPEAEEVLSGRWKGLDDFAKEKW